MFIHIKINLKIRNTLDPFSLLLIFSFFFIRPGLYVWRWSLKVVWIKLAAHRAEGTLWLIASVCLLFWLLPVRIRLCFSSVLFRTLTLAFLVVAVFLLVATLVSLPRIRRNLVLELLELGILWIYIKHKENCVFIRVFKLCRPVLICWKLWSHLVFELFVESSTASEAVHIASLYVISADLAKLFVILVQARIGFQVSHAVKE